MSINSSSSPNDTFSIALTFYQECLKYVGSNAIFTLYTFTNILFLVPLYLLILYIGFQRWRHQRSVPAGQTPSHSDFFTYHMVAVEICGVFGSFFYCLGIYASSERLLLLGIFASCVIFPGQTLFHLLTCVERYLAVVHPVNYMRLRETGGVRIRNISILCTWLVCFGWVGITKMSFPRFPAILIVCIMVVSLVVICFCGFSVLRVLIRPGPGEVGGAKERVDQSKQRAFHIIRVIMGALLLRFVGLLVSYGLSYVQWISTEDLCVLMDAALFLTVPSSLVLPLLFLHKNGKLACCRSSE